MSDIWKFLARVYEKMPTWVQVSAFFVMLVFAIYLYLAPNFVDGQLVIATESGGFVPYRGTDIQISIEGRTLKFRSNEDGYFSIPVVSRLPQPLRLNVYHQDTFAWHPVEFNWTELWRGDFQLFVSSETPYFEKAYLVQDGDSAWRADARSGFLASVVAGLFPGAAAGELIIPESYALKPANPAQPAPTEPEAPPDEEYFSTAQKVLSTITGVPRGQISRDSQLRGSTAPSFVQRIQLVEALERQYILRIPDEHWQAMKTLGELSAYIGDRKALQVARPAEFGNDADWVKLQSTLPEGERIKFRPD